jgi:hypothetical protein
MHQPRFILVRVLELSSSRIAAPCTRQLQSRYLTEVFLRVLNRGGQRKSLSKISTKTIFLC